MRMGDLPANLNRNNEQHATLTDINKQSAEMTGAGPSRKMSNVN